MGRQSVLALLGCVALTAGASVASGQTNPSDMSYPVAPSTLPQTRSATPGETGYDQGSVRDRGDDGEYAGGLPYRELAPVPQAAERLYVARALHRQAHLHVENVYRSIRRDFEKSGGYLDAAAGEREAFQAYADARDAAVSKLQDDPEYTALVSLRDKLSGQLEARRHSAKRVQFVELMPIAQERMRYNQLISAMESEAIRRDAAVDRARQRFVETGRELVRVRSEFDESLRTHPSVVAAVQAKQKANVEVIGAEAYAAGVAKVRNDAIDFAYRSLRHGRLSEHAYPAGGYYGYGYAPRYGYGGHYKYTSHYRY